MATLAKLAVELSLTDKFSNGLKNTKENLDKWGDSLRSTGTKFTLGLTTPIVGGFGLMIKSASDMNEATSAVQTVFKNTSKDIIDFSNTTANAFGIAKVDALDALGGFGALAMSLGVAEDSAAKMGISMVSAAGDMASFNNANPSDTLAAVQSALVGQYEPLLKYKIALNESTVAQKAMEMSGKSSADQLTNAEKVLARATLITEGLGAQQGDAARTADGLANVLRRLRARGKDLAAKWGQLLLPNVLKFSQFLIRVTTAIEKMSPKMQKLIMVGLALAAAIGPILIALGMMLPAISILLGPIGLIILAVGLLAAAFATDFMGIRGIIMDVVDALGKLSRYFMRAFSSGESVKALTASLPEPLQKVGRAFFLVADAIGDLVSAFKKGGLSGLLDALPGELGQVWEAVRLLASETIDFVIDGAIKLAGDLWDASQNFGAWMVTKIRDNWDGVVRIGTVSIDAALRLASNINWSFFSLDLVTGVAKAVRDAAYAFSPADMFGFGQSFGEALGPALSSAVTAAFNAFKADPVGSALLAGKIVLAVAAIFLSPLIIAAVLTGALAVWVGAAILGLVNGIAKSFGIDFGAVGTAIADAVKTGIDAITTWGDMLLQAGKDLLQGLSDGADETWKTFKNWISNRGINAQLAIGGLIETLSQHGKDLLQGLYDGGVATWKLFKTWISNRGLNAQLAIGGLIDTLLQAGKDLLQGLYDGAFEIWLEVSGWLGRIDQAILNSVGDMSNVLYWVGGAVVSGMASGIADAAYLVTDAVNAIINAIPDWVARKLGIKSPSTVMRAMFYNVPKGMALGMRDGIGIVRSATESLAGAAIPSMSGVSAGMGGYSGSANSSTSNYGGITINVSGAGDPNAVADRVFSRFVREMALTTGGV